MNKLTCKSTLPKVKYLIDDYSQRSLALLILGSGLNTNCQPLKFFCGSNEIAKI